MVEELKIEQAVYRVSEILFEGILIDLFNDDDPLRHSPYLRENRVRLTGMMQHCDEQRDVEAVIVEGNRLAVVEDGLDFINKTEISEVQGNYVVAALSERLGENTVTGPHIQRTIARF